MRLLSKKLEVEIVETLHRAVDNAQRAMKLVEEKDREIKRLQAELTVQQAIREFPVQSHLVH